MPTDLRAVLARIVAEAARMAGGRATALTVLHHLIAPLPVAALVANSHGSYVLANRAATDLTGYEPAELYKISVWDLTPSTREREAERLWPTFLQTRSQSGEYALKVKGGRVVAAVYAAHANVLPGLHLSLLRPADREMNQASGARGRGASSRRKGPDVGRKREPEDSG
jgi:PAS domain S-box-containing protein